MSAKLVVILSKEEAIGEGEVWVPCSLTNAGAIPIWEFLSFYVISIADLDVFLKGKLDEDSCFQLLSEYYDFVSCFSRGAAKELLLYRLSYDMEIVLIDSKELPFKNLYPMLVIKNEAIKKWVDDQLSQSFIYKKIFLTAVFLIVVKKPKRGLWVCIDYRAINVITIKNKYPIPLVYKTLTRFSIKKWFIKLDIIVAFNRIRIAEGYK